MRGVLSRVRTHGPGASRVVLGLNAYNRHPGHPPIALSSVLKSVNLIQEVPDETNTTEIVQYDTPPKLSWLFGAVDRATAPP